MVFSIKSLFMDHPASVGESYMQHMHSAATFSFWLLIAAIACGVHAIFPFACVKTGSKIIIRLNLQMTVNRDQSLKKKIDLADKSVRP